MYTITQRNWCGIEVTAKQPQRPCFVIIGGNKPAVTTEHDNTTKLSEAKDF